MSRTIGIIRETKNKWERRTPLVPADVRELLKDLPVNIQVQPSALRIFEDHLYSDAGAALTRDLKRSDIILGIKEIKIPDLLAGKVYLFFSHTVKGQDYNMPMLKKIIDLKCTLIDYEKIANDQGQRLIYFSLHAGLAGIVETLWGYGQILKKQGIANPFTQIRQTYHYRDLSEIQESFEKTAREIRTSGLPESVCPLIIGVTGYGNVARGVHQLLDILPVEQIDPEDLSEAAESPEKHTIYTTVFKEQHMVEPIDKKTRFELQDYYDHPEKYRSCFGRYLPYLSVLVNATYWDTPYPRHVTKNGLQALWQNAAHRKLRIIGDISCDIDGGIEITCKATDPGDPVFTYDPVHDRYRDGFGGDGIVVMSVDNLPSELPRDASVYFSGVLKTLIPALVQADFSAGFAGLNLPGTIKDAVIVYQGELTPGYAYLEDYLG
jgi:alpha-aminoadipic semialdehyde synthase